MSLIASLHSVDRQRACRLMIAWAEGDHLALDVVLAEALGDPVGTPGLLFALTECAGALGQEVGHVFTDQLRGHLLAAEAEG